MGPPTAKIRVTDNYVRFYLKAIRPLAEQVLSGLASRFARVDISHGGRQTSSGVVRYRPGPAAGPGGSSLPRSVAAELDCSAYRVPALGEEDPVASGPQPPPPAASAHRSMAHWCPASSVVIAHSRWALMVRPSTRFAAR